MHEVTFAISDGIVASAGFYCDQSVRIGEESHQQTFTLKLDEVDEDVGLIIVDFNTSDGRPFAQLAHAKLEIKSGDNMLRTYDLSAVNQSCLISFYLWRKPAGPWLVRFAFDAQVGHP